MPILHQRDAVIDFDWTDNAAHRTAFSVEWTGVLRVPDYGDGRIWAGSARPGGTLCR